MVQRDRAVGRAPTSEAACLAAFLAAFLAMVLFQGPAAAVNLLEGAEAPEAGRWSVQTRVLYAPYFLTLEKGVPYAKDCSDPPKPEEAHKCWPQVDRPFESRHFVQATGTAEYGLGGGLGLEIRLPVAYVRQFNAEKVPKYMPGPTAFGTGDLSLGLRRMLYRAGGGAISARLRASVPTGTPALGNEIYPCEIPDATGVAATRDFVVFPSVPSADLMLAASQEVLPGILSLQGNAGVNYPFRRTVPSEPVTWRGMRYDYGGGLEYHPIPALGLHLEALVEWANPAEQIEEGRLDHILVCSTGHIRLELVPGVSYRVARGVTVRAAAATPILQNGYQRDFPLVAGTVALALDL